MKRIIEVEIPDGPYCGSCQFWEENPCGTEEYCRLYIEPISFIWVNCNFQSNKCKQCLGENKL